MRIMYKEVFAVIGINKKMERQSTVWNIKTCGLKKLKNSGQEAKCGFVVLQSLRWDSTRWHIEIWLPAIACDLKTSGSTMFKHHALSLAKTQIIWKSKICHICSENVASA